MKKEYNHQATRAPGYTKKIASFYKKIFVSPGLFVSWWLKILGEEQ
jgi:hypothetical protein